MTPHEISHLSRRFYPEYRSFAMNLKIMARVEALPPNFRRAFLLHYNGMKYKDIATITNVPVGTAKSRVWTARNMLRDRIKR